MSGGDLDGRDNAPTPTLIVLDFRGHRSIREGVWESLADARQAARMTQGQFAGELTRVLGYGDVQAGHVAAWERGIAAPPGDVLVAALTLAPAAARERILGELFGEAAS